MSRAEDRSSRMDRIRAVKQAYEAELMKKANVQGVGIGFAYTSGQKRDEVVLVVMVKEKVPAGQLALKDLIPAEIEGVPVDVQAVGEVRAQ